MQVTQSVIQEFLNYDPLTGHLVWNVRDLSWFKDERSHKSWNTRFAGKVAFTSRDSQGYLQGAILGKQIKAHRVIWFHQTGIWPDHIDHDNRIKTDNRWINLIDSNPSKNQKNLPIYKNNTSGVTGVYWDTSSNKWLASICVDGKRTHLGLFQNLDDAAFARKIAEKQHNFHKNHGVV